MSDSREEPRLYYPLEEDEFRLLLVSPGQPGDQLICNLVHASYDDPPSYEALSYVWGSMDPSYFLDCSDVQVRVTKNLHEALCHFRLESQIRIVWADALCINQSDNPEKSIQVNRMREIYENCANLLVWFGAPAPGVAEDAWEGLRRLRLLFEEHTDVETLRYTKQARNKSDGITELADKLTEWEHRFRVALRRQPLHVSISRALASFFSCPWFTRVWIVQEIILAPGGSKSYMTLAYGDTDFDWETLSIVVGGLHATRSMEYVTRYMDLPDLNASLSRLIQVVDHARSSRRTVFANDDDLTIGGTNSVFWEFLLTAQRLSSTDPRDKIYGMLSVIEPDVRSTLRIKLQPDYAKSAVDLYTDVSLFFIFDEGCLDILELTYDQPDNGTRLLGLPTWVNDWTQKSYLEPFHPWFANWGAGGFNAGLGTTVGFTLTKNRPKLSEDRRRLCVRAYFAGTIDWHVPPESEYINTPHFAEYRQDLNFDDEKEEEAFNAVFLHAARYKDCLDRVLRVYTGSLYNIAAAPPPQDIKYSISDEIVYEAFWRSLICNLDASGQIPDLSSFKKLYTYFHAWQMRLFGGDKAEITWGEEECDMVSQFQRRWHFYGRERRFFVTSIKTFGWATRRAQVGDHVAVLAGTRCPYVIREVGDGYELIGPAYVHGLMESSDSVTEPRAADIDLIDPPKDIWLI
jgi:hypothetical protein